jgi:hypothetical protein
MRKHPVISAMILALLVLAVFAAAEAVTVTYTARPGAGPVFAVVDFPREGGLAQPARVNIDWGTVRRNFIAVPYGRCDQVSPAGFVIKLKQMGQGPLKLTTTGTIIRGPYQGDPPLELLHTCYRVQK